MVERSKWVLPLGRLRGTGPHLLFFPPAGGSASSFAPFRAWLSKDIGLLGIEYPGHGTRLAERPLSDIATMASAIIDAIRPYAGRQCVLFGYSFGALVAYEVARRIIADGQGRIGSLIVSACAAPSARIPAAGTPALDDAAIIARMHSQGLTQAGVFESPELLGHVVEALRADWSASQHYVPSEPTAIAAPISAYGGREDIGATEIEIERWREMTSQDFRKRVFPGGHNFVHEARHIVAQALTADLHLAFGSFSAA